MQDPLLLLDRVTVYRGGQPALRDLSLRIDADESVVILGANGAGKSTFIKLLTREVYPHASLGSIKILGQSRWYIEDLRGQLGIVSNDLAAKIDSNLTGLDAVLTGFTGHTVLNWRDHITPEMIDAARDALHRVGALGFIDRPLKTLSSGEMRRVLVARALAHCPKALLLDEPTTSLDLPSRHEFMETIRNLKRQGLSILLVTHHLEEILPIFDRVILMRSGQILKDGPRQEVMTETNLGQVFGVPIELYGSGPYTATLRTPAEASR